MGACTVTHLRSCAASGGVFSGPALVSGEQAATVAALKAHFLPQTALPRANVLLAWHGCAAAAVESICAHGCADLRTTDGGFFGAGVCAARG